MIPLAGTHFKRNKLHKDLRLLLGSINTFSLSHERKLRRYQLDVTEAVEDMLSGKGGRSMAVMLPRQSGKNEVQLQVEAFLLVLSNRLPDAEIIKISPTLKPQSIQAMRRLENLLDKNFLTSRLGWRKEQGTSIRLGRARISFYSGMPGANIVGATASLLLSVDEAQHISVDHFDTHIAPMAAARNTARIFWGTAWTRDTLLARELRLAEESQTAAEGPGRRAFRLGAQEVGAEVPPYAVYVAEQVKRLGRYHPAVRTQYYSEEIDAAGGMFPAAALEAARGDHAWLEGPRSEWNYAFLLDVGGEQIASPLDGGEEHDATALVIVEVEAARGEMPLYRVVHLRCWSGAGQPALRLELLDLAQRWKPRKLVVDATGLGQGLAAALEQALRGRVLRFLFTASSKNRVGWGFRAMVGAGRFRLPRGEQPLVERLREQMAGCVAEVGSGPDEPMRWSVPERSRAVDGTLLHDDLLTAAALATQLDGEAWLAPSETLVIRARDPLREMDGG